MLILPVKLTLIYIYRSNTFKFLDFRGILVQGRTWYKLQQNCTAKRKHLALVSFTEPDRRNIGVTLCYSLMYVTLGFTIYSQIYSLIFTLIKLRCKVKKLKFPARLPSHRQHGERYHGNWQACRCYDNILRLNHNLKQCVSWTI